VRGRYWKGTLAAAQGLEGEGLGFCSRRRSTREWGYDLEGDKGLFGSVAIHWMVRDIHFFSGYPMFGSVCEMDRGNQILWNILSKSG
jgi:hypothetical protein